MVGCGSPCPGAGGCRGLGVRVETVGVGWTVGARIRGLGVSGPGGGGPGGPIPSGGGGCGREDYVQCAAARLQEQNGSLLHMDSFGAIPRVERNVLACPTLKEPASL